jgi:hypothetical protein
MGSISKRFKALIEWAESQKTEDGRLAALVLHGIWLDVESALDKSILEFEEVPIIEEVV